MSRIELKQSLIDLLLILLVAGLCSGAIYLVEDYLSIFAWMIVSLAILVMGMNLAVYLLRINGTALLFLVFYGLMTFRISDFGILGWDKVLALVIAGIVFELIYYWHHQKRYRSIYGVTVISTAMAIGIFPLIMASLMSLEMAKTLPLSLFNLSLVYLLTGIAASILSLFVWQMIRNLRLVIRLRAYLQSLEK